MTIQRDKRGASFQPYLSSSLVSVDQNGSYSMPKTHGENAYGKSQQTTFDYSKLSGGNNSAHLTIENKSSKLNSSSSDKKYSYSRNEYKGNSNISSNTSPHTTSEVTNANDKLKSSKHGNPAVTSKNDPGVQGGVANWQSQRYKKAMLRSRQTLALQHQQQQQIPTHSAQKKNTEIQASTKTSSSNFFSNKSSGAENQVNRSQCNPMKSKTEEGSTHSLEKKLASLSTLGKRRILTQIDTNSPPYKSSSRADLNGNQGNPSKLSVPSHKFTSAESQVKSQIGSSGKNISVNFEENIYDRIDKKKMEDKETKKDKLELKNESVVDRAESSAFLQTMNAKSTKQEIILDQAEKESIGYITFMKELRKEVSGDHNELWTSFQIMLGYSSPKKRFDLHYDQQSNEDPKKNGKRKKRLRLDPEAQRKLEKIHEHLVGVVRPSHCVSGSQLVNDKQLGRGKLKHDIQNEDRSLSKHSVNENLMVRGQTAGNKRSLLGQILEDEGTDQSVNNGMENMDDDASEKSNSSVLHEQNLESRLNNIGDNEMIPKKISRQKSWLRAYRKKSSNHLTDSDEKNDSEIREPILTRRSSSTKKTDQIEGTGRLINSLTALNKIENKPSTLVKTNASSRPPIQSSSRKSILPNNKPKKSLSWLAALREKQKQRKKELKESSDNDDDDKSVNTIELETSAASAVSASAVVSIFGKRVASVPKQTNEFQSPKPRVIENKGSPWSIELKPVPRKLENDGKREYNGPAFKMKSLSDKSRTERVLSFEANTSSISVGDSIDIENLPPKAFPSQAEPTIFQLLKLKDGQPQVVIISKENVVVSSCPRNGVSKQAIVSWCTRRSNIRSLTLNKEATSSILVMNDRSSITLPFENAKKCLGFTQAFYRVNGTTNDSMAVSNTTTKNTSNMNIANDQKQGTCLTDEDKEVLKKYHILRSEGKFNDTNPSNEEIIMSIGDHSKNIRISSLKSTMAEGEKEHTKLTHPNEVFAIKDMITKKANRDIMEDPGIEAAENFEEGKEMVSENQNKLLVNHTLKESMEDNTKFEGISKKIRNIVLGVNVVSDTNEKKTDEHYTASLQTVEVENTTQKENAHHQTIRDKVAEKLRLASPESNAESSVNETVEGEHVGEKKIPKIPVAEEPTEHDMNTENVDEKIVCRVLREEGSTCNSTESANKNDSVFKNLILSEEEEKVASTYRKMLKVSIPPDAVRHKMSLDKVSERICVAVLGPDLSATEARIEEDPQVLTQEEETIASTYKKMLKMSVPKEAVRHRMIRDKVDQKIILKILDNQDSSIISNAENTQVLTEEEETIASTYKKMLKMSVPKEAVRHRMIRDKVDQKIISKILDNKVDSSITEKSRVDSGNKRKSDLVALHWTPLSLEELKNSQSVWNKSGKKRKKHILEPAGEDLSTLEKLFKKKTNKKGTQSSQQPGESNENGNEMAKLLEINRAQNVSISLKAFKDFSLDELVNIIKDLDPDRRIEGERTQFLSGILPTASEVKIIETYKGDESRLVPAEIFFLRLQSVNRVVTKIKIMQIMELFHQNLEEVTSNFELLENACNQVMNSEKLQLVLESVLAVGNIMNEGTRTGGAAGFKFDSLLKLTQTKSIDGKMTVLDYIVMLFIEKNERSVLDLLSDFPDCQTASRILITDIVSDAASLRKGIKDCRTELIKMKNDQSDKRVTRSMTKSIKTSLDEVDPRQALMASILSRKEPDDEEQTMNNRNSLLDAIKIGKESTNEKIEMEIDSSKQSNFSPGLSRLESFIKDANVEVSELEKRRDSAVVTCKELANYCGEGGGERAATALLGVLAEFAFSINVAVEKYDKRVELEAKRDAALKKKEEEKNRKKEDAKKSIVGEMISCVSSTEKITKTVTTSDTSVKPQSLETSSDPRTEMLRSILQHSKDIAKAPYKEDSSANFRSSLKSTLTKRYQEQSCQNQASIRERSFSLSTRTQKMKNTSSDKETLGPIKCVRSLGAGNMPNS